MLCPEEFWAIYGRGARLFDATGRELRTVMACSPETGEVIRWDQSWGWSPLAWLVSLLPRPRPTWPWLYRIEAPKRHGFWPAPLRVVPGRGGLITTPEP